MPALTEFNVSTSVDGMDALLPQLTLRPADLALVDLKMQEVTGFDRQT